MSIFKCKMCGGDLIVDEGSLVAECESCGTNQTVPSADSEKKVNMFNRANKLRLDCEFDKAAGLYEGIIADFPDDSEAYWGLVLCKYGVEYVEDPDSHQRIPTVHRTQFQPIINDGDYKSALDNADTYQKTIYEQEAEQIEAIRIGILDISKAEEPCDVFICYKETDNVGQRTEDSVLAYDVYEKLTEKGYRVFFSRVTLENKLGQEYEPYIFSALNSAKVMLAVGTKPEYYNSVWVKNEWSRFLKIASKDKSKVIIPCYKDMKPEDLPDELKRLQSQDMNKIGAIQDVLFTVDKIINRQSPPKANYAVETVVHQQKKSPFKLGAVVAALAMIIIAAVVFAAVNKRNKDIPVTEAVVSTTAQETTELSDYEKYEIGDIYTLGKYEQNNKSDGKELISWYIIDKSDGKFLLLSEYALDCIKYEDYQSDATWETCSLRKWLNSDFLKLSFSKSEQSRIMTTSLKNFGNSEYNSNGGNDTKDKIFILSEEEYKKYINDDRYGNGDLPFYCPPTDYAINNGADYDDGTREYTATIKNTSIWWLRTPGNSNSSAACVVFDGYKADGCPISAWWGDVEEGSADWGVCVRPAMWINARAADEVDEEDESDSGQTESITENNKYWVVNTEKYDLNVRQIPDINGKIMAKLKRGTVVEVEGTVDDWSAIIYDNGKTGWVKTEYIKKQK